jgi:Domain of unknown function (DUF5122) beta-propeller
MGLLTVLSIRAAVTAPDGKIVVTGDFSTFNGANRNRIARLNSNGSLDMDFNPGAGAGGVVRPIALQSDGNGSSLAASRQSTACCARMSRDFTGPRHLPLRHAWSLLLVEIRSHPVPRLSIPWLLLAAVISLSPFCETTPRKPRELP